MKGCLAEWIPKKANVGFSGDDAVVNEDCEFCDRLRRPSERRPWYDFFMLGQSPSFCVVAALGALAPGHIMIVSDEHVERMADLDAHRMEELVCLVRDWVRRLGRTWSLPCFVFEHGGRSDHVGRGGCIAHAHLQLVPLNVRPPLQYESFHELFSLEAALRYAGSSDYLLSCWNGLFYVDIDNVVSGQFVRRQIAGSLGRPDEWDYLVFPNHSAMRETIGSLCGEARPIGR